MTTAESQRFESQIRQNTDFVYSAALRQVGGDAHLAEDITQAVFILLADKGAEIAGHRLAGWLFKTTRYLAKNARRRAARRQYHERRAVMEPAINAHDNKNEWEKLRPHLDEAVAQLAKGEREVVLLHFFQHKPFAEVAIALDLGESTARKRASRAIGRLRKYFESKGIVAGAVGELLLQHAVAPAPSGFSATANSANGSAARELIRWIQRTNLRAIVKLAAVAFFFAIIAIAVVQIVRSSSVLEQSAAAPAPPMVGKPALAIPAINSTTQLSPPDLSDVVSLRFETTSNAPGLEVPTISWSDTKHGAIAGAVRRKIPGGDYRTIDIDGQQWRWQNGAGVVAHYLPPAPILRPAPMPTLLAQLTHWCDAGLIRESVKDERIDGQLCRAFRESNPPAQAGTKYFWADDRNRLRKRLLVDGNWNDERVFSYNPVDVAAAFTPPAVKTIELNGLLDREYPIQGAAVKNAVGLDIALHHVKRESNGGFGIVISVHPDGSGSRHVNLGHSSIQVEGGDEVASLWDSAGVIYGIVPPVVGGKEDRCQFTILVGDWRVNSPGTRVKFDVSSQGDEEIAAFAGDAYDATARLAPMMRGTSGVIKKAQVGGKIVRYPIAPPIIGRDRFIASVVSQARN